MSFCWLSTLWGVSCAIILLTTRQLCLNSYRLLELSHRFDFLSVPSSSVLMFQLVFAPTGCSTAFLFKSDIQTLNRVIIG
jgi:hypothetical protein